ncbi:MAG: hypothetical protein K5668_00180 [Lachnospiraceae bacterium]|nr:hypothetical protein [Lachnospiraceae bacterium]
MENISLAGASPIVLILALIIAVFLWMEGYKLYRLAVFFLGFITGFMLTGMAAQFIPTMPVSILILQIAVGLVLGAAAFMVWKLGIFIAAACGIFLVLKNILASLETVGMVIAFAAAVVGGFVATKADKPVIIIITGIVGGFAIPTILLQLMSFIPYDMGFLPPQSSFIWIIVKVVVSAAGIGIQFSQAKESD